MLVESLVLESVNVRVKQTSRQYEMGTVCTKGLAAIFNSWQVISTEKNCDPWLARPYACAVGVMHDPLQVKRHLAIAVEPNTIWIWLVEF